MTRPRWTCESCGEMLAKGERYVLKVASYAAYDGLNINLLDFARDLDREIAEAVRRAKRRAKRSLDAEVVSAREYSLCRRCRWRFMVNPLRGIRPRP